MEKIYRQTCLNGKNLSFLVIIIALMENFLPALHGEIVFSSSNSVISRQISKLEKTGRLRKVAPRIYTTNQHDTPQAIVLRNLWTILGYLYPGGVLSHRSALEFQPTPSGHIYLTNSYSKKIELPGVVVHLIEGPGPVEGDNLFAGQLYAAQQERALLENLQPARKSGNESKALPQDHIEERLEQVIRVNGESGLNLFRDTARKIAEDFGWRREFDRLNRLISALLKTKPSKFLTSPIAIARAFGNAYDPGRINLFQKLFIALNQNRFGDFPDQNISQLSFRSFAFYEAYFSNFIEGTEFDLDDAKRIIETQTPMPARNEDSHDILGTFELVSSREEMSITPSSAEDLIEILLRRHKMLMNARASKKRGQFKHQNNRAGETFFVDHELVKGTLMKGFEIYRALEHPFSKAAFIMFMVAEIHPFMDGNGRMARIMMNAELVKASQSKILIPTVFRDDYMTALRRLTRQFDPDTYIKMLGKIHHFSWTLAGGMDILEEKLRLSNAFKLPEDAQLNLGDQLW